MTDSRRRLQSENRVHVPESVLTRELDGELVILDLVSERYFGLDEVGARIWSHLVSSADIGSAFEATLSEYAVDRERLSVDFERLLDGLLDNGLIELKSPA